MNYYFVLKITVLVLYMTANYINVIETKPLGKERLTVLAEWTDYNSFQPEGPGTYSFGYDIEDPAKDNIQFRDEERLPNGTVKGSYGYLRPDGVVHIVHYTADKEGFRTRIENYPRGQLKPLGSNAVAEESRLSSALTAAVQSKVVYKKQHLYDQHLRPVDINTIGDLQMLSYISANNTNHLYPKNTQ